VQWLVFAHLFISIISDNFLLYDNTHERIVPALEGIQIMPMFNPASGINNSDDLEFMSQSYAKSTLILVQDYLSVLASQLMKHRYLGVQNFHVAASANSNIKMTGAAKA
jgi:hypothetical protein